MRQGWALVLCYIVGNQDCWFRVDILTLKFSSDEYEHEP